MPDRLWFRFMLVTGVVLALAVGAVALTINHVTGEMFTDYVEDVSQARAQRVDSVLSRHYQRSQSWAGVEPVVQLVADLTGQRVVLADAQGQVVADSQQRLVGQQVQSSWASEPVIISYQDRPVGSVYLDPLRPSYWVDNRGQTYLTQANQSLAWAAGVGLLAALMLSLLSSRWLARPLEALTHAARRMERGDLSQRIDVRIGGEIGELARAFNSTAAALSRLERLRQQMVTDIAHELRTPLTNIRGYLEAIQDGVVEPNAETLGILEHELGQLTRLVNDLQELALVEAGELSLTRQELNLAELIQLELRSLRPQAEAREVVLEVELAPDLPPLPADPGRLGQVLRNLLRNALAHTGAGGRITVAAAVQEDSAFPGGRAAVIRVRDTGVGIADEHLPHIFERFYRGDRSRQRQGQGGYGLGLTITRELVQAHGGEISARSIVDQGTEFTIKLPLTLPAEVEAAQPAPAPRLRVVPAGRLELLRTGVLVGALFGATAGLMEAVLYALAARKLAAFTDLFGYWVLARALGLGLLGGASTVVVLLAARALRKRFDLFRQVAWWTPVGCLLVGGLTFLRLKQSYLRDEPFATPQALFVLVLVLGLAAWLALLAGALLGAQRGSGRHALLFARRLAPGALAILVGLSGVGVVRDLGARGLGLGAPVAAADPFSFNPNADFNPDGSPPGATQAPAEPTSPATPGPNIMAAPTATTDQPAEVVAPRGPNVLLITLDSLRADHLGSAGYPKARTPTLDRLAAEGVRFTNAISNQPGGAAAHASILTGTYPATHTLRRQPFDRLPEGLPTLAESFAARGYTTAGLFSWLALEPAYSGLDRGFQVYSDLTVNLPSYMADSRASTLAATIQRLKHLLALPGGPEHTLPAGDDLGDLLGDQLDGKADVTTAAVVDWIRRHQRGPGASGQPFFLWAHYFDPHYPYTPPSPFDQLDQDACTDCRDGSLATIRDIEQGTAGDLSPAQINRLLQYYDGEIAFTDRELGRLLEGLRKLGLLDQTLIVVVGDHGESFGERGYWFHGRGLHDAEVHVPLLMRLPGALPSGKAVDAVSQLIDLKPTILELIGLPVPPSVQGRSLLPLVRDQESGQERFAVAELADRSIVSLVTREWRLLKNTQSGAVELYRMSDDPDDLHDLAEQEPEILAEHEAALEHWRAAHP